MTATPLLTQVLADLAEEGDRLDALLAPLPESRWRTPTPAAGWDVAHQIAHLAWTDEVAVAAATDPARWQRVLAAAAEDPTGYVDVHAAEGAATPSGELLGRWRTARRRLAETLARHPHGERIPWFGPPMSATSMATARFMETWAHGLDVHEALGREVRPSERIRHVAHLGVRTRDFAFAVHGLPAPQEEFRVELVSPRGELWTWGPEGAAQAVRGPAYHFCLLVTQRRHRADLDLVVTGADADRWLDVAQAFAGLPGGGRPASGPLDAPEEPHRRGAAR
ncbi:MAG TPA: TIGR03084 family metal-binding protein [Nocardioidaceae bacterium]